MDIIYQIYIIEKKVMARIEGNSRGGICVEAKVSTLHNRDAPRNICLQELIEFNVAVFPSIGSSRHAILSQKLCTALQE